VGRGRGGDKGREAEWEIEERQSARPRGRDTRRRDRRIDTERGDTEQGRTD
jgi:hypothetical protein